MPTRNEELVRSSIVRLDRWIESQEFKGWDPHDALNSPLLKKLTFGSRWLGTVWVQLLKRNPINLRPLLGVPKGYNPKGMGLFLASYLRMYELTSDSQHMDRVRFFADWLERHISPGYSGACWGYNFDWPNRGFFAPAWTPTVVNTAFIGLAFLDLYRRDFVDDELRSTALRVARSAADFLLTDLNIQKPKKDEICFSYTPLDRRYVHNANMLGAWLLSEVYDETRENLLGDNAVAAARFTVRRQRADGSWPYGEAKSDGWVDNFHTGFVLVALNRVAKNLGIEEFKRAIELGYVFWKKKMFLPKWLPKYYPDRVYPLDVHSFAQAILTFLEFHHHDCESKRIAWNVARWSVEHMQHPDGYFYYQIHRNYINRIPYMRWSQAWMFRALIELMVSGRE